MTTGLCYKHNDIIIIAIDQMHNVEINNQKIGDFNCSKIENNDLFLSTFAGQVNDIAELNLKLYNLFQTCNVDIHTISDIIQCKTIKNELSYWQIFKKFISTIFYKIEEADDFINYNVAGVIYDKNSKLLYYVYNPRAFVLNTDVVTSFGSGSEYVKYYIHMNQINEMQIDIKKAFQFVGKYCQYTSDTNVNIIKINTETNNITISHINLPEIIEEIEPYE